MKKYDKPQRALNYIMGKIEPSKLFNYFKKLDFEITEKIDGIAVRIYYNGNNLEFYGKKESSILPVEIVAYLNETFNNEVMLNRFKFCFSDDEATIFGVCYGEGINENGYLENSIKFNVYDIYYDSDYASCGEIVDLCDYLGIARVPIIENCTKLENAIKFLKKKPNSIVAENDEKMIMGIIAKPLVELKTKDKERLVFKMITTDVLRMRGCKDEGKVE